MNPLTDVLPPKARKYAYAVVSLAALVYGAYTGAHGDWGQAVGSLIGSLVGATAASNTSGSPE